MKVKPFRVFGLSTYCNLVSDTSPIRSVLHVDGVARLSFISLGLLSRFPVDSVNKSRGLVGDAGS